MINFRLAIFTFCTTLLSLGLHAQSIDRDRLTLVARAGLEPYALPTMSSLSNTNPVLTKSGFIIFKYWGYDDRTMETLPRFFAVHPSAPDSGVDLYQEMNDWHLSDPFVTPKGLVIFSLGSFGGSGGIWQTTGQHTSLLLDPKRTPDVIAHSSAALTSRGELIWRSTTKEATRRLDRLDLSDPNATVTTLIKEGDPFLSDCIITYIFTPQVAGPFIAARLRLACNENEHFIVARFNSEKGTWNHFYGRSNNNLAINEHGTLAYLGLTPSGERALFIATPEGELLTITTTPQGVGPLETFAPSISAEGLVAFRSFNTLGERTLFIFDTENPSRGIIPTFSEGSEVPLEDNGTARILQSSWGPGFAGAPMIEGRQVIQSVVLEEKGGGARLGSAIYLFNLD
jgi:hypothetical protein